MNTPICDFVSEYNKNNTLRLHMPGHKGQGFLKVEDRDITEIKGADSLFEATSIIRESEQNASEIFGAHTFYSTEGSSLCIRAMMYLVSLYAKKCHRAPLVLASRNVHKTFVSAAALCDIDVEWLYAKDSSYLSCDIDAGTLDKKLCDMTTKPVAVYVTSPDYLGNVIDIKALSDICHKHSVLLIVDNAHGEYLKFLETSRHPIDLGADLCCGSAHKTLPVLTGGAYLHISKNADSFFVSKAKAALSLFASTSPSYLILQSLDYCNKYMYEKIRDELSAFSKIVCECKSKLKSYGYTLVGDEELKITIATKEYGYTGTDFAQILRGYNIECEFCDPDYVVLMLTPNTQKEGIDKLTCAMRNITRKHPIVTKPPVMSNPVKVMSIKEAVFSDTMTAKVSDAVTKVLADMSLSCPPAVPILVSGEQIDESAVEAFEYYGINKIQIVK